MDNGQETRATPGPHPARRATAMAMAPAVLFRAGLAVAFLAVGVAVWLALRPPAFGVEWQRAPSGEGLIARAAGPLNAAVLAEPTAVVAMLDADGRGVVLDADLLTEDPDQLGEWVRYNDFMARQGRLTQAAQSGSVTVVTAGGQALRLATQPRGLADLPWLFWLQCAAGAVGFLVAVSVWCFRPQRRAATCFAVCGAGLLLSALCAAVYSSRGLLLDGDLFAWLSSANHVGSMTFAAAFVALWWNYPRRLGRWPMEGVVAAAAAMVMVVDTLQWLPSPPWSRQAPILLCLLLTFALAVLQWRRVRGEPVERAEFKWFLLSLYLGTALFAVVVLLPVALGTAPLASQGLMFVAFLLMFFGIALGITRYRLFDLDRWWFRAWGWFLGGVAVIGLDLALVAGLGVASELALAVSLAALGWLYFPVRQWLWHRFTSAPSAVDASAVWLQRLFGADSEAALAQAWRALLNDEFAPMQTTHHADAGGGDVRIEQDGLALDLPDLEPTAHIRLLYPDRGTRLFGEADRRRAALLHGYAARALAALRERERGTMEERQRVMRDLHDDLGAKLLSLVYAADSDETRALARAATRDLRDILAALEAQPCALTESIDAWQAEAVERVEGAGGVLAWQVDASLPAPVLQARERANLGRILREAVSNALRHGHARSVAVSFVYRAPALQISIEDDGRAAAVAPQGPVGRGTRLLRGRAHELAGTAEWSTGPRWGGWRVVVSVTLSGA